MDILGILIRLPLAPSPLFLLIFLGRLYTMLDVSSTGPLAQTRQANDPEFQEVGGVVDVHTITPEEVLQQARSIFHPWKLEMAVPLSWFAVWKSK